MLVAGACASFGSSSNDEPIADAGEAGNEGSAPPPLDGSADAENNILSHGDFGAGCTGWHASGSTVTDSTNARDDGGRACLVCAASAGANGSILQRASALFPVGSKWIGEGWVAAAMDAGDAASSVFAAAEEIGIDGGGGTYGQGTVIGLTASWQRVSVEYTIDTPNVASIQLQLTTSKGGCFLVDDAMLYPEP
jgi:hypothetical protein